MERRSRSASRITFGSLERCTDLAMRTPAFAATSFATSLSKARAEASAPGPVKAMLRTSSMRWMVPSSPSPPWSARNQTREGCFSTAATREGKAAGEEGRKSCSKGLSKRASSSRPTTCTAPLGARNQAAASSSTAETCCAEATETRRSLLEPPKRTLTSVPGIPCKLIIAARRAQRYDGEVKIRSTTVVCVRRDGKVALGADGQVTLDKTVLKHGAKKLRRLGDGSVLAGFAGATADAFT